MSTVSGNQLPDDFGALSEAEQRVVAERLLRIEESGWKPFWCPDPQCDGMPHWLLDRNDAPVFVAVNGRWATAGRGPNGEPLDPNYPDGYVENGVNHGIPVLDPAWAHNHARQDQRLPGWMKPWVLFIMSGRGSGKTRTGVEFVTLCARKGLNGAILGRRGTELVNTHVAETMAVAHPDFMPVYSASKDILTWPNGAITYLFSAEKPENIRSVNLSYAWVDEAAFMDEIETAWMNLKMATRIEKPGNPIHFLITSTPTPTKWVMEMEDDPDVIVRRVSTYANRANLSASFLKDLEKKYEGTRMGRQELHGEVLRDVEGALWNDDLFRHHRVDEQGFQNLIEQYDDRVLAIDPAGSKGKHSDATGIIGCGGFHFDDDGKPLNATTFDVICRATIKGSPTEWAEQAYKAARLMNANRIVAEKNFGGDMVKQVLTDYAKLHPSEARDADGDTFKIEVVHAQTSKETRAEATVGKYEQGRVRHVSSPTMFGDLSGLEKEQVNWVPKSRGGRSPSPNDVDALVWAIRALESKVRHVATQANRSVVKALKRNSAVVPEQATGQPVTGNALQAMRQRTRGQRLQRRFPVRHPRSQ